MSDMMETRNSPEADNLDGFRNMSTSKELVTDRSERSTDSSASSSPRSKGQGRTRASSLNGRYNRSTAHLTQQQINKKRQRATPEQLSVLEESFTVNPNPDARTRELISGQISMTERSVQIWFQNRRAKTRSAHRRPTLDEGSFQQEPFQFRSGPPSRSQSIDHNGIIQDYYTLQYPASVFCSRQQLTRLNCRSLTFGAWRRVACTAHDLICSVLHSEGKFSYSINDSDSGFKIQFSIASILGMTLQHLSDPDPRELGRMTITLCAPPEFFMLQYESGRWERCNDFTENQQASTSSMHSLIGPYEDFRNACTEMVVIHKDLERVLSFDCVNDAANHYQLLPALSLGQEDLNRSNDLESIRRTYLLNSRRESENLARTSNNSQNNRYAHRRTRSRSAPIFADSTLLHSARENYIQATNLKTIPTVSNAYSSTFDGTYTPVRPGLEYSDGFCTPTTTATSNYQDPWLLSSYENTPSFDRDFSQLDSPSSTGMAHFSLFPIGNQFDNASMAGQHDFTAAMPPLPASGCTNTSSSIMASTLPVHGDLSQLLPEMDTMDNALGIHCLPSQSLNTLLLPDSNFCESQEENIYADESQVHLPAYQLNMI